MKPKAYQTCPPHKFWKRPGLQIVMRVRKESNSMNELHSYGPHKETGEFIWVRQYICGFVVYEDFVKITEAEFYEFAGGSCPYDEEKIK